jgi:hypothetical protein
LVAKWQVSWAKKAAPEPARKMAPEVHVKGGGPGCDAVRIEGGGVVAREGGGVVARGDGQPAVGLAEPVSGGPRVCAWPGVLSASELNSIRKAMVTRDAAGGGRVSSAITGEAS